MNWVGGARSRLKSSWQNEKKIQREYFERKRLVSSDSVRAVREGSHGNGKSRHRRHRAVSQDIESFKRQSKATNEKGSDIHASYRVVNLGLRQMMCANRKGTNITGRRQVENVELPLSPIETPSVLQLSSSPLKKDKRLAAFDKDASSCIDLFGMPLAKPVKMQKAAASSHESKPAYAISSSRCSREVALPHNSQASAKASEFTAPVLYANKRDQVGQYLGCGERNLFASEDFQEFHYSSEKYNNIEAMPSTCTNTRLSSQLSSIHDSNSLPHFPMPSNCDPHFISDANQSYQRHASYTDTHSTVSSYEDTTPTSSSVFIDCPLSFDKKDTFAVSVVNSPEYRQKQNMQSQSSHSDTCGGLGLNVPAIDTKFDTPIDISDYMPSGDKYSTCEQMSKHFKEQPTGIQVCEKDFGGGTKKISNHSKQVSSALYPPSKMHTENEYLLEHQLPESYSSSCDNEDHSSLWTGQHNIGMHNGIDLCQETNSMSRSIQNHKKNCLYTLSSGLDDTPTSIVACKRTAEREHLNKVHVTHSGSHNPIQYEVINMSQNWTHFNQHEETPMLSPLRDVEEGQFCKRQRCKPVRCGLTGIELISPKNRTKSVFHMQSPFPGDICPNDQPKQLCPYPDMDMNGMRMTEYRSNSFSAPVMTSTPQNEITQKCDHQTTIALSMTDCVREPRKSHQSSAQDVPQEKHNTEDVSSCVKQVVTHLLDVTERTFHQASPSLPATKGSTTPFERVTAGHMSPSTRPRSDNCFTTGQNGSIMIALAMDSSSKDKGQTRRDDVTSCDNDKPSFYNVATYRPNQYGESSSDKIPNEENKKRGQYNMNNTNLESSKTHEVLSLKSTHDCGFDMCQCVKDKPLPNALSPSKETMNFKLSVSKAIQTTPKCTRDTACSPIVLNSDDGYCATALTDAKYPKAIPLKCYSLRPRNRND